VLPVRYKQVTQSTIPFVSVISCDKGKYLQLRVREQGFRETTTHEGREHHDYRARRQVYPLRWHVKACGCSEPDSVVVV
jgi:hypothetical protein